MTESAHPRRNGEAEMPAIDVVNVLRRVHTGTLTVDEAVRILTRKNANAPEEPGA